MNTGENIDPKPVSNNTGKAANESGFRYSPGKPGKEEYKKGVIATSVVGGAILVVISIIFFSVYSHDRKVMLGQMEAQKNSLSGVISERDSIIGEWIATFDEVEKNIAMIKEKEHMITMNASNSELSKDKRQQVLDDIQSINSLLEANKQKIATLTAQLKKSGGTIKALEKKIADLQEQVKQNENEITELKNTLVSKNFEIDQLNTQNTDLKNTIVQKDEKITQQTNELNKAFYAVGTTKELKTKGLLTKKGGFIGLGKTKTLATSASDSAFVQIDLTKTNIIPVGAKKAKLISEHAPNSYTFLRDKNDKIESIEIKDPALFWKLSKYAVVQVTR